MNTRVVLVIEDDRRYRDLLEMNLKRAGYAVALATDGLTGLHLLERDRPDLVILDLALPDIDGYEVCQRIRDYSQVPIIMLTARAEGHHKIRGLNLGADDYVTKPFAVDELIARIAAVLRRAQTESRSPPHFHSADLTIDFDKRRVTIHGREVRVTRQEYKLLYHLAVNAGQVLVHEELLYRAWGAGYEGQSQLLHSTVQRLRRKIEATPGAPRHLLTKRGIGYLLAAPSRR
jgi:two-component system KDP operon response regulator KdpE